MFSGLSTHPLWGAYDITGYPNEIIISVYNTEWHYQHNCMTFQIMYTSDDGKLETKKCVE